MRELLSNNSLFVGQLQADKSLALRARDLIAFTTDLQTVNHYSTRVASHFEPRSFRTQVISYLFGDFVSTFWSFRTQ